MNCTRSSRMLYIVEYTTSEAALERFPALQYFYKYAFDFVRFDVALWIVGRNLVLADAVFSIAGKSVVKSNFRSIEAGMDRREIWGTECMDSLKSGSVSGIKRHSNQKRINNAIQNGGRKE